MLKGTVTFKCDACGRTFKGLDIEWGTTFFTTPQRCPHCGSIHTYPYRLGLGFLEKSHYVPIWKELEDYEKNIE